MTYLPVLHADQLPRAYRKDGRVFHIHCRELGLETSGRAPSTSLCRAIMEKHPEYADAPMKVYDEKGMHSYTIKSIKIWAGCHVTEESTSGLHVVKYREVAIK